MDAARRGVALRLLDNPRENEMYVLKLGTIGLTLSLALLLAIGIGARSAHAISAARR